MWFGMLSKFENSCVQEVSKSSECWTIFDGLLFNRCLECPDGRLFARCVRVLLWPHGQNYNEKLNRISKMGFGMLLKFENSCAQGLSKPSEWFMKTEKHYVQRLYKGSVVKNDQASPATAESKTPYINRNI